MGYDSYLSWTSKKHQKTLLRPLHSKLKKIKDFSRTSPKNSKTFQYCANPDQREGQKNMLYWEVNNLGAAVLLTLFI